MESRPDDPQISMDDDSQRRGGKGPLESHDAAQ